MDTTAIDEYLRDLYRRRGHELQALIRYRPERVVIRAVWLLGSAWLNLTKTERVMVALHLGYCEIGMIPWEIFFMDVRSAVARCARMN